MASAKEEKKRKQKENKKEKRYLVDFLLYVELDKEKAKKRDIAFYDRQNIWMDEQRNKASIC